MIYESICLNLSFLAFLGAKIIKLESDCALNYKISSSPGVGVSWGGGG